MSSDAPQPELADDVLASTNGDVDEMADIVGAFASAGSSGGDELSLYENWMPGAESHQGKTNIKEHQAHALAAVRQLANVYGMLGIDIEGLEQMLISLVKDYEQYKTSVDGKSREEQVRVLMAKAGVHADMEEAGRSLFSQALRGDGEDE